MNTKLTIPLYLALLHICRSMKVFTFGELSPPALSSASLLGGASADLPDKFTMCISHKQTQVDTAGSFQLYGEDQSPWLALQFLRIANRFQLWVFLNDSMELLEITTEVRLHQWVTTCLKVDTTGKGTVSVKVNNQEVTSQKDLDELTTNKPSQLAGKLSLGKSTTNEERKEAQFTGSVSNFRVFQQTYDWPSCETFGDILTWDDSFWATNSATETSEDVCSQPNTYRLAVPYWIPQKEAIDVCTNLGQGKMLGLVSSEEELAELVIWVKPIIGAESPPVDPFCKYIWSPLVYQEGLLYDGKNKENVIKPVGLGLSNSTLKQGIFIDLNKNTMRYENPEESKCFSCELNRSTNLLMRGQECQTSLLGRPYQPNQKLFFSQTLAILS